MLFQIVKIMDGSLVIMLNVCLAGYILLTLYLGTATNSQLHY